ncbi:MULTISPECIES: aminotransferase class IV family protein [unclassified Marinovum]
MENPFRDIPHGTRLIETMLWQPGQGLGQGVALAHRHRDRMAQSAARLGFPFTPDRFDAALAAITGDAPLRLRLTLNAIGDLELTSAAVPPPPIGWRIAVAPQRLIASDPWLSVKSTRRALYDTTRANLPQGIDEALFLNEHGFVCEGTITNLLVEHRGRWLTPPLSDGVLPGVMRAELLAQGALKEQQITLADFKSATRLRLCNALRGQIEVAERVDWPH